MPVAEIKTSSATAPQVQQKREPFFSKEGQAPFFSGTNESRTSFFNGCPVQPKLTIGHPNDKYEVEADAMADKVVKKLSQPLISNSTAGFNGNTIQAKCAECEQEDKVQPKSDPLATGITRLQRKPIFESNAELPEAEVQRKAINMGLLQTKCAECTAEEEEGTVQRKSLQSAADVPSNVTGQISASKGKGDPLGHNVKKSMESGFGADFSTVRIHTGSHAIQMSRGLNAQAFTHGSDIYFNQGKYDPGSYAGRHLLAHELTHTVQQGAVNTTVQHKEDPAFDLVSKRSSPGIQRKSNTVQLPEANGTGFTRGGSPFIQAKCETCEKEESLEEEQLQKLQMKSVVGGGDLPPDEEDPNVQRRALEMEKTDYPILFKRMPNVQLSSRGGSGSGTREQIVEEAQKMVGKVEAKKDDGSGRRQGAEHLLEIFHLAAKNEWPDEVIERVKYTHEKGFPHWCGIFSVYAIKKAGIDLGYWQMGKGVSAFGTLEPTTSPQPGDIGYFTKHQHHCIIKAVNGDSIDSIDGNSGNFSEVIEKTRPRSQFKAFFTPFTGSEQIIQNKNEASSTMGESGDLEGNLLTSTGKGTPMDEKTKGQMESGFGVDFSGVNIHADSKAAELSAGLGAQAFTHGNDIYFNHGKYNPESSSGKHLLAHELTHTVQQGAGTRGNIPILRKETETPNFNFAYDFKNEVVFIGLSLKQNTLAQLNSNQDGKRLISNGLDKVLYISDVPVYETPTFLKTNRIANLISSDIELWPGNGPIVFTRLNTLIRSREKTILTTFFLTKVITHLKSVSNIDPAYIDWKILIPELKEDLFYWEAKSEVEASEYDQYEWFLDLLEDEVKDFDPVAGAKSFDPIYVNDLLYPFVLNNEQLFTEEIIQEHSEKFLKPWLAKIAKIKYVPEKFSVEAFKPGEEVKKAEKVREKLLNQFIQDEVPDLMFSYVLDQWAISGVDPNTWINKLNLSSYKDKLLDHLTGIFLKKAKLDPEYANALKLMAVENTKYNLIRLFHLRAMSMQAENTGMENQFSKGFKSEMDQDLISILENPAEYYHLSVEIASATMEFLGTIQPDRSIANQTMQLVIKITNALKIPEKYGPLLVGFLALMDYIKQYQNAIEEEESKIKDAIRLRIKVDYEGIAKIINDWYEVAERFMEQKFKPMLKTVALEWLANNKKEVEDILANYDSARAKNAMRMNEAANELQLIVEGLENDEYEEVEYEGEIITKDGIPDLRTSIQVMHKIAEESSSKEKGEEEKGKLREALEDYEVVRNDIKNNEYEWLDYASEIFVESRKRLGIGEFPEFSTYRDVFTSRVVASKSPFLAKMIQSFYFKEDQERKMYQVLKVVGLGLFSVAAMLIPGFGGLVLKAIDVGVSIGMGVHGVIDAKEVVRLARLDIHGNIRGVSVSDAEKALKNAWIGLVFTAALTVGPAIISRGMKIRGKGGVNLNPETRAWERSLSKGTRDSLKSNPALRKVYAEMDESVRRILTLCESPCIPLGFGPKPAEVARIKNFMKKLKIPQDHRGLREYLHHPSRRNNLASAMDGLDGVKNMQQLEVRLERAIAANVKQSGASATKIGGIWNYTRPDKTIVKEFEIASHGNLTGNRGTSRFFQSHHGIQDAWAARKGIPGYARDDCPAILLRDSKMGTPHQIITARQSARLSGIEMRTYAQERDLLLADMAAAGVPKSTANKILGQSDIYFGNIYRQLESQGKTTKIVEIFGTWKPK